MGNLCSQVESERTVLGTLLPLTPATGVRAFGFLPCGEKKVNLKSSREKASPGSLIKDSSLAKLGVIWPSLKE